MYLLKNKVQDEGHSYLNYLTHCTIWVNYTFDLWLGLGTMCKGYDKNARSTALI